MFKINAEALTPLEEVTYLGRTITYNNRDCMAVYQNPRKAPGRWGMIARVLVNKGPTVRFRGMMYNVVAQLVLLYGIDIWVVTGEMIKLLEGLHHQAARRIMGRTQKRGAGGEWEYPPLVEAMEAAGLHSIWEYIRSLKTTIVGKVVCRTIYELYSKAQPMPGTRRMVRWWDQDLVNETKE